MSGSSTMMQAQPAHFSNEDAPAMQAASTLDVTFRSGQKVGLKFDSQTGIVKNVTPDSQADRAGVKMGWVIVKIDADAFSQDVLSARIAEDRDFIITFEQQAQPVAQENPVLLGQPVQHAMAEPRKAHCQSIGFSDHPQQHTCPSCGHSGPTRVDHEASTGTHLVACGLCLVGVPCCLCFVPYCCDAMKEARHYCPKCNAQVGEKVFITK